MIGVSKPIQVATKRFRRAFGIKFGDSGETSNTSSMLKTLLITLLIGLSFNSFSMRKKKQLELINSCQIFADNKSVFAGMNIPTYLAFNLKDGQKLYSNSNSKFGFKDFKISVEGSGEKQWRSKRKLTVATYYNAINDPYIRINVQMIERPEIGHTFTIPIHFNGTYRVNHSASSGSSGVAGQKWSTRS
jgi:hypothetical protein